MSHCEWKPIEEASKADSIHVWDGYELVKAYWTRYDFTHEYSWCTVETDQYGEACYTISPQPKYYLAVTPPPEG